jgi:hypothetical protein
MLIDLSSRDLEIDLSSPIKLAAPLPAPPATPPPPATATISPPPAAADIGLEHAISTQSACNQRGRTWPVIEPGGSAAGA